MGLHSLEAHDHAVDDAFDRRRDRLAWIGKVGQRIRERPAHAEPGAAATGRRLARRNASWIVRGPAEPTGRVHASDDREVESDGPRPAIATVLPSTISHSSSSGCSSEKPEASPGSSKPTAMTRGQSAAAARGIDVFAAEKHTTRRPVSEYPTRS